MAEVLVTCGHCGNKDNCKIRAKYIQDLTDKDEYEHFVTTWYTLECPACRRLILQQTYEDIAIMLDFLETILEYLYVVPTQVNYVKVRLSKTP